MSTVGFLAEIFGRLEERQDKRIALLRRLPVSELWRLDTSCSGILCVDVNP